MAGCYLLRPRDVIFMMNASPLAPIARKVAPIVSRLDTEHAGERLACVAALERLLHRHGLRFVDLGQALESALDPSPAAPDADLGDLDGDDRDLVLRARNAEYLSDWEHGFLAQLARIVGAGRQISPKQRAVVRGIIVDRC